jgi:integrase
VIVRPVKFKAACMLATPATNRLRPCSPRASSRRGRRSLALPAAVAEALDRHRARQHAERVQAGARWRETFPDPGGLLFTSSRRHPDQWQQPAASVRRLRAEASVEGRWTPYSMRHTAVSLLSDAAVAPELIADLLGHVDTRMVHRVYRHTLSPVVEALDGVLDTPVGPSFGADRPAASA